MESHHKGTEKKAHFRFVFLERFQGVWIVTLGGTIMGRR